MYRRIIAFVVACVAVWCVIGFTSKGEDKSESVQAAAFAGKYLEINTKGEHDWGGGYLSNPEVRTVGGRNFIVGKSIAPNNRWKTYEGKIVWIAWDEVIQITVCDSLDDLKGLQN